MNNIANDLICQAISHANGKLSFSHYSDGDVVVLTFGPPQFLKCVCLYLPVIVIALLIGIYADRFRSIYIIFIIPDYGQEMRERIAADKKELGGEFCRGCGYCMKGCPAKIDIGNCARISLLLRRGPVAFHLTPEWRAKVEKIKDCINCGQCRQKCPYGLDTPALLRRNYEDYQTFL